MKKRLSFQQRRKHTEKKCHFCGENDYSVLDTHRIVPGSTGGKYSLPNVVVCCCTCHRRIHSGEIVIDKYYNSTKGLVLHYFIGEEEYWE